MTVSEIRYAPVVALDIGNVCLRIRPLAALRILGMETIGKGIFLLPEFEELVEKVETGRLSTDEYLSLAAELLPGQPSEYLLREAWLSILGEEMPGMGSWVRRAHEGGLSIVLFSDTSAFHYEALLPRLSFAAFIDGAVLSYEVGSRKPGAEMYSHLEQTFCEGRYPVLYIDDREENIAAARSRGWRTYHFGNMAGAEDALDSAFRYLGRVTPDVRM